MRNNVDKSEKKREEKGANSKKNSNYQE